MEPDALFVAGVNASLALDMDTAQACFERAAQASEKVAHTWHEEGSPFYLTFMGLARLYEGYFVFLRCYRDFSLFAYDRIVEQKDVQADARQAADLLAKGDLSAESYKNALALATGISHLLASLAESARLMQKLFSDTFKPDVPALRGIRENINAASNAFAKVGQQSVPLMRFCEQFSRQVENMERLAKPRKKDFGALAGLVACALFLPLFLVVSWVNHAFSVGLAAPTLFSACLVLALIGGFGYGAMKFRSLLSDFSAGSAAK